MILDTRPQVVDIRHYSGDTLTIKVFAPAETVGLQWDAQIKADRDDPVALAVFTVTPATEPGGPAFLTLSGAQVTALGSFNGVWDCQVSAAGSDPIRTLMQGKITIDVDVSRLP